MGEWEQEGQDSIGRDICCIFNLADRSNIVIYIYHATGNNPKSP